MGLIIGTAGHIDHGKTSLVHALTGIDTDRLPIEKARGITTELGFAFVDLPVSSSATATQRVGFIDVPGHEKFVHAMVAGVGGIDVVCLVVAADEGVKPQTREHIDICRLVGVRRWVVALTKIDLVDATREAAARAEIAAALAAVPYAGAAAIVAPVVAVSSRTGAGLAELRQALADELAMVAATQTAQVFRLPIDRVFSKKGIGTVVTGTVHGCGCAVGDELMVNPTGVRLRVRGLQTHGVAVERVAEGERAAINVTGIGRAIAVEDLHRGEVVYAPAALAPSHIMDVALTHIGAAKQPLPGVSTVMLHHGTGYQPAKLQLVGATELAPGHTGLAQLRVEATQPLAALPGDRFVIRGSRTIANHGKTVGGGEVLRIASPRFRLRNRDYVEQLTTLQHARATGGDALNVAHARLELAGADLRGLMPLVLGQRLGLTSEAVATLVAALVKAHAAVVVEGLVILASVLAAASSAMVQAMQPAGRITRSEAVKLCSGAAPETFAYLLAGLVASHGVRITDEALELATHANAAKVAPLPAIEQALLAALSSAGLEAPRPSELAAAHRMSEPAVLAALHSLGKRGLVAKIKPDYFVTVERLASLRARLLTHFATEQLLSPQQWKVLCEVSRKFAIPLIEYFDAEKLTLRVGDNRKLRNRRG